MVRPTPEELDALVEEHGSNRKVGSALGVDEATVRRWRRSAGHSPSGPPRPQKRSITINGDEAVLIEKAEVELGEIGDLIRSFKLDPDEWDVVSTTLNRWEMLAYGGGPDGQPRVVELGQRKVTLRKKASILLAVPAQHIPELLKSTPVRRLKSKPRIYVIEGDHQIPYHDEALDAAATALVADLQPDEHIFLGDTGDYPTISRHDDHPAQMATPQDCLDGTYAMLRRRAEVSPNTKRRKLKGNHDWRLEAELLKRAERMYGIRPVGEEEPALSLRRLLHLDALGVELVEHQLGWQHAEVELITGHRGLVVRHGWLTGHNTAGRSMAKRGRSLIVGHNHSREHVFWYDPSIGVERQAAVAGVMCQVRSPDFPVYNPTDDSLQGLVVVTHWPDQDDAFTVEHARWYEGALYLGDQSYRPSGKLSNVA